MPFNSVIHPIWLFFPPSLSYVGLSCYPGTKDSLRFSISIFLLSFSFIMGFLVLSFCFWVHLSSSPSSMKTDFTKSSNFCSMGWSLCGSQYEMHTEQVSLNFSDSFWWFMIKFFFFFCPPLNASSIFILYWLLDFSE